ncbi:MAG: hypothetical protein GF375_05385 [Candidatus Omnitrophica bacterium]|nr:hypothetical protein [Candidatus Omnitrophota bacterium]MBD3269418.1 hypothetical protein [Candidatus Omnitrophota bacterium]
MFYSIKGLIAKKEENRVIIKSGDLFYEVMIPYTVYNRLAETGQNAELVVYSYINIDKNNRGIPVMVGFVEELEREFFEKFISVSGVGPKAALKAFDKPVAMIARAIEEADTDFLKSLAGVGNQKAKQIIAHLQGKVGRFALIKESPQKPSPVKGRIIDEARDILKRLQYNSKEIEDMIKKVLQTGKEISTVEELLNEIYRQKK